MKSAEYQIFNLTAKFTETIRDPLWKDIPLSSGFKKLFLSEPMQKLNRIKQLGPTYLLYPGALHNRASHSLGVFHLTRLIILSLLSRSSGYGIIPSFTDSQINALLAASMLHDLGHFPYAHALKDIVKEEHEKLGALLIKQNAQLCSIIENDLNSSVDTVCQIIDNKSECNDKVIIFFRTILSGTLDPDKLDYLSRDALFCGVPYGVQDASYIIRNLVVTKEMILALPFEAIGSVEHLLFAKYSMYRNVYWHHVTRSATAMIKKAVLLAFKENLFSEKDLYNLDDESFANLFSNHKESYSYSLFKDVRNNHLYKCHASLYSSLDSSMKREIEKELYTRLLKEIPNLKEHQVIVDIPEKVSFETDLPILIEDNELRPFNQVTDLFKAEVESAFASSLTKVRLFLPQRFVVDNKNKLLKEILNKYE